MKTIFLIRGLEIGGAERQLIALAIGLKKRGHDIMIIVFYGGGVMEAELRAAGIRVEELGKAGRWEIVRTFGRLLKLVRHERPDILHGYLTVSNLLVGFMRPFLPGSRVVWGIRSGSTNFSDYDWTRAATDRLQRWLARSPHLIICNSDEGQRHHASIGYPARRLQTIHNGIDTSLYRPDARMATDLRRQWGVEPGDNVVGIVARLEPLKGHSTLFHAAAFVMAKRHNLKIVCVGAGAPGYEAELRQLAARLGIAADVVWAGRNLQAGGVYNGFDIYCSSSAHGEGFPNVIAEAMASGVPCLVTDVGDSAKIVGNLGAVVAPRNADALAAGMLSLFDRLDHEGGALKQSVRQRVVESYGLERLVQQTEECLQSILCRR